MSVLLQARDVSHAVGGRTLFSGLELVANAGDRLGLVGHNGCGKTTLLDVLSGATVPDAGEIQRSRGLRLGRVEQFLPDDLGERSVLEAAAMSAAPAERWRAEMLLQAFGFAGAELTARVGSLSGGQQNRLMFARALIGDPELLLLDEPTNHLDLATLVVFEQALREFSGAFLLVSHDREFLDAVTRETLFLRDGRVQRFALPFSPARVALAEMDEAAARARRAEEAQIDRVRRSAARLAEWGKAYDNEKFARRARNMAHRVERMELERTEVSAGSPLSLDLTLGSARSRQALVVENLGVAAGDRRLFHVAELIVRTGERVALLGHNGVGKTTFIRRLVEALGSADPRIRFSPQTRLGYYDQELDEVRGGEGLMEFAVRRSERDEQTVRGTLIHAGFPFPEHAKPVSALSGGERARLLFAVLSLNAPNLLIMDEPTNHIDIEGREELETQLLGTPATLLITSHDRRFLSTVATRFLWVRDGGLVEVTEPEAFFASEPDRSAPGRGRQAAPSSARPGSDAGSLEEDRLLARIIELESLLEADLARRPKHQKPELQRAWREELARLYPRLD